MNKQDIKSLIASILMCIVLAVIGNIIYDIYGFIGSAIFVIFVSTCIISTMPIE